VSQQNLAKQVERGNHAKRLMEDPLLQEAFETVRLAIHEQWANSPLRDLEGQTALRVMLNHLRDLQAVLEVALSDGKAAVEELNRLNKRVISPKEFFNR
jgi:hypothetical protein